MNHENEPCRHRYYVGYSFRMPNTFFRSVPCDFCHRRISLTLPWRIIYVMVNLVGFFLSFSLSQSVSVPVFGTTLPVTLLVFLFLMWMIQLICRLILRFAKWKETDQAGHNTQPK